MFVNIAVILYIYNAVLLHAFIRMFALRSPENDTFIFIRSGLQSLCTALFFVKSKKATPVNSFGFLYNQLSHATPHLVTYTEFKGPKPCLELMAC